MVGRSGGIVLMSPPSDRCDEPDVGYENVRRKVLARRQVGILEPPPLASIPRCFSSFFYPRMCPASPPHTHLYCSSEARASLAAMASSIKPGTKVIVAESFGGK